MFSSQSSATATRWPWKSNIFYLSVEIGLSMIAREFGGQGVEQQLFMRALS